MSPPTQWGERFGRALAAQAAAAPLLCGLLVAATLNPERRSRRGRLDDCTDLLSNAPITLSQFRRRMLNAYSSPEDAFAALDASPANLNAVLDDNSVFLDTFVRGTKTFVPPLTQEQAEYAFAALDANRDKLLSAEEFLEVLRSGHFVASASELQMKEERPRHAKQWVETIFSKQAAWADCAVENSEGEAAPITMAAFKISMLSSFNSTEDAFAEFSKAAPVDVARFIDVTTSIFRPPLSELQARYAFKGLDANHDGNLTPWEFLSVLGFGHFFPTDAERQMMSSMRSTISLSPQFLWLVGLLAVALVCGGVISLTSAHGALVVQMKSSGIVRQATVVPLPPGPINFSCFTKKFWSNLASSSWRRSDCEQALSHPCETSRSLRVFFENGQAQWEELPQPNSGLAEDTSQQHQLCADPVRERLNFSDSPQEKMTSPSARLSLVTALLTALPGGRSAALPGGRKAEMATSEAW